MNNAMVVATHVSLLSVVYCTTLTVYDQYVYGTMLYTRLVIWLAFARYFVQL